MRTSYQRQSWLLCNWKKIQWWLRHWADKGYDGHPYLWFPILASPSQGCRPFYNEILREHSHTHSCACCLAACTPGSLEELWHRPVALQSLRYSLFRLKEKVSQPLLQTGTLFSLTCKYCRKRKLTKCMDNKTLVLLYWHSSQDFILTAKKQGICCYPNLRTAVFGHQLREMWLAVSKTKLIL